MLAAGEQGSVHNEDHKEPQQAQWNSNQRNTMSVRAYPEAHVREVDCEVQHLADQPAQQMTTATLAHQSP